MMTARRLTGHLVPLIASIAAGCATDVEPSPALRFSVREGRALNEFYRREAVAAHLVVTGGESPRLVIAFPAGNSGAALWFDAATPIEWSPDVKFGAAERPGPNGVTLHGVTAELGARGGPMTLRQAIASSVRVIRNYEDTGTLSPQVVTAPQIAANTAIWSRRRLDGAAGYYIALETTRGTMRAAGSQALTLTPDASGRLQLRVTALTGDKPLTPLAEDELLKSTAARDERLRRILTFLAYEEKLLAGSWRFNTYFGRDTLMSVSLLAPAMQPPVIEAGLRAVLERLNAWGEVAHEEDIGEFAVLRHLEAGRPASDAPIYDYKMIDDDFMLPLVAAHYLLDTPGGRDRARAFLARAGASGETYRAKLLRNFGFVVQAAAPFAREPVWRHLIALKPGVNVGNWRDSEVGLGGGRYPYDVNVVLTPAALDAIARLHASGLLQPYPTAGDGRGLVNAASMAAVWRREAARLFQVTVPSSTARTEVEAYARAMGVEATPALAALGDDDVRFGAVSLDAQGRPIPILNSDEGFALLFLEPESEQVEQIAEVLMRPFPAGLMTDVGLLVANPAYAAEPLEPIFDRTRYHGAVIWSWQQEMLAAGIDRQLAREGLTGAARAALGRARNRVLAAIRAADELRGSELWSWSQTDGRYRIEPFGQRRGDETESNAAQLWSTVQLARPRT